MNKKQYKKNTIALLYSSGLESSTILLQFLNKGYNIIPLYVENNLKWEKTEKYYIRRQLTFLKQFFPKQLEQVHFIKIKYDNNINNYNNIKNINENVIINRNLLLISNASTYILENKLTNKIAIGLQGTNSNVYKDTSIEYIRNLEKLIQLGSNDFNFQILLPLYGYKKEKVVGILKKELKKLNILLHKNFVDNIFSCSSPVVNNPCGECYKCKEFLKIKNKLI